MMVDQQKKHRQPPPTGSLHFLALFGRINHTIMKYRSQIVDTVNGMPKENQ